MNGETAQTMVLELQDELEGLVNALYGPATAWDELEVRVVQPASGQGMRDMDPTDLPHWRPDETKVAARVDRMVALLNGMRP